MSEVPGVHSRPSNEGMSLEVATDTEFQVSEVAPEASHSYTWCTS